MNTKTNAAKHRGLLEDFVKALTSGDRNGVRACFKEDAVWHIPPYYVKFDGRRDSVGREEVVALLFASPAEFYKPETIKIDIHFMIADEKYGAYQFTNTCKTAKGEDYFNIYVFSFRFEDGLIAEVWEHIDSAYFNAQIHGKI
jgi:ketosteroid isomerase-like protein